MSTTTYAPDETSPREDLSPAGLTMTLLWTSTSTSKSTWLLSMTWQYRTLRALTSSTWTLTTSVYALGLFYSELITATGASNGLLSITTYPDSATAFLSFVTYNPAPPYHMKFRKL